LFVALNIKSFFFFGGGKGNSSCWLEKETFCNHVLDDNDQHLSHLCSTMLENIINKIIFVDKINTITLYPSFSRAGHP